MRRIRISSQISFFVFYLGVSFILTQNSSIFLFHTTDRQNRSFFLLSSREWINQILFFNHASLAREDTQQSSPSYFLYSFLPGYHLATEMPNYTNNEQDLIPCGEYRNRLLQLSLPVNCNPLHFVWSVVLYWNREVPFRVGHCVLQHHVISRLHS